MLGAGTLGTVIEEIAEEMGSFEGIAFVDSR